MLTDISIAIAAIGNSNHNYQLTAVSANVKTGKIPVSATGRDSCPDSCPLKGDGGCYGENYGTNFVWNKIDAGKIGGTLASFVAKVSAFPAGQLWRHDQVGDLPNVAGYIDAAALGSIVQANIGKRGFTYTHHLPSVGDNGKWIAASNAWGFAVNLSANTLEQADEYLRLGIAPVVCLIPPTIEKQVFTPAGNRVVVCPGQRIDHVTCESCKLCAVIDRSFVIGFIGHGTRAAKVIRIATAH